MRLELATQNDFDAIIAFYDDVTARTPEMGTYARWQEALAVSMISDGCNFSHLSFPPSLHGATGRE